SGGPAELVAGAPAAEPNHCLGRAASRVSHGSGAARPGGVSTAPPVAPGDRRPTAADAQAARVRPAGKGTGSAVVPPSLPGTGCPPGVGNRRTRPAAGTAPGR